MTQGTDRSILEYEFDRQAKQIVAAYHARRGSVRRAQLEQNLSMLKARLAEIAPTPVDLLRGQLPFVIIVPIAWERAGRAPKKLSHPTDNWRVDMYPCTPGDFRAIDGLAIPQAAAYMIVDVERGGRYNNVTPRDALKLIKRRKRSALTIDEGIAVVARYPEFLVKNNCFSLLGSRIAGDARVPALWITQDKRTRLGWCWEGNPHSWLGSASCGYRVGPDSQLRIRA